MLVVSFPAAAFATNCYVVAPAAGEECLVVDPGIGVVGRLDDVLREHRLRPAAVLLTHGHADHVYSVTPVCGARDVAAYIHGDDRYRLVDPLSMLDPMLVAMLEQQFGERAKWAEPDDVRSIADNETILLAGLSVTIDHAPGHTEGSVLFRLPDNGSSDGAQICLTGDVLFEGSIGRTDLPGGDNDLMMRSLAEKVLPLRDDTVVLPGHGPATTIGRERATNPFLRGLMRTTPT
ncbi:MAG TPA: MBL fold metallo-hydrolase [Jiangellaceae bacterium]|nr:MBL fold metallo-hydrolase [Jiangellaceae bacterium]